MPFSCFETERLIVRRFTDADLPMLLAYRNDPEIARYQSWESFSANEAQAFLQEQQALEPGVLGKWFQFAIELKSSRSLIGDCALHVDEEGQQGEIGFTLAGEYQGKGFAIEAVSRVCEFAFTQLNLHRVVAITDCRNLSSIALLERLGLRREGHFIQHIFFKGAWGDEYSYAILKEEWHKRKPEERKMTSSQEVREFREKIVRQHMESENVQDFAATMETFSHPRYEIIPTDKTHDGVSEVEQYFRESRKAFPDQRNELISLRHADDAVIVEFWLMGTHKGKLAGLEPTGREFRCRMTAFFIFDDKGIICERVYFDSATMMRQLTS